jgi:hypothetical protein
LTRITEPISYWDAWDCDAAAAALEYTALEISMINLGEFL